VDLWSLGRFDRIGRISVSARFGVGRFNLASLLIGIGWL